MGTTKRHTAPGTSRREESGRETVIMVRPTQAQYLRRESREARVSPPSGHLALQLAPTSRRPAASTQTTSREAKRIHHVHDAGSAQTRAHVAPRQGIRTDVHYPWPRKSWWRRNGSAAASRGGGAPRDVDGDRCQSAQDRAPRCAAQYLSILVGQEPPFRKQGYAVRAWSKCGGW